MSWVYFIVGITCLIALQALRTVLSMQFPVYKASPIRRPDPHSFGGMDLIDAKTEALLKLGFDGPAWVGSDGSSIAANYVTAHATYRNKADHVVAWLGPTIELAQPGQLLTYYTTLLQDGRYAITQVSDPYFAAVDDPRTPAQTIPASDEATEIELHKSFVATLGVTPAEATPREDVLHLAGEHMTSIRSRLLERGRISESAGIARPTLSFAVAVLRSLLTRPKPATPGTNPVPTPRLTFLAGVVERARDRAPSQPMQWLLLLLSSVLFVAIGWPLLGLEITLVILGVIAFHEAGHWVAMRMFGYRNPHITLLPLLGGVTIGHETDPSAAKRAWVALAGPLPGIILAWILIYLYWASPTDVVALDGWALSTIIVLLFVNYLNVLPIPPLDGSHIVQALLPPRWLTIQTLFILIGVAIGIYVAYLLEFWPIALIAALQLLGLKSLWRTTRLVQRFSKSPPPAELRDSARTAWLLTRLEEELGAPKTAARRIVLAGNILTQLDTQPMGGSQRAAVSSVYIALLVVPIAALALTVLTPFPGMPRPEVEAMNQAYEAEYDQLYAGAAKLGDMELLETISGEEALRSPASEEAIAAAEARLGRALPEHLRDFYELTNGMPESLGLGRVEDIRAADPETFQSGDLMYSAYEGALYFYNDALEDIVVPVKKTNDWWYIGSTEQWLSYVYVDPYAKPGEPGVFSLSDEDLSAYETMRELLESAWIGQQSSEIYAEHAARLRATVAESMSELTLMELIDEFPKPSMLEKLVIQGFLEPGPASPDALTAAEARVGHPLPADYRQLLEVHNGFLPMAMLPIEEIQPAQSSEDYTLARALEIANETQPGLLTVQDIASCWAIAGHFREEYDAADTMLLFTTLFWCPKMDEEYRYLSLVNDSFRSSFTEVVRDQAALMNTF